MKIKTIFYGIIFNVKNFDMYVELLNTIEGLMYFENLEDEYFIYDNEHKTLIGEKTKELYKVEDRIKIKVIEANKILRRISFAKI